MFHSLSGQFLIAAKDMLDPNFFKTVVLMVEHTPEGAMGIVVNRPTSVTVANALAKHFTLPETEDLVYVGGPVEPNALFVLHDDARLEPNEEPVVTDLYVGSSAEVFERIIQAACDGDPGLNFRIFSGCAGWGPGQLDGELRRGDWLTCPATSKYVFDKAPYDLWDTLLQELSAAHRIVPETTHPPDWN